MNLRDTNNNLDRTKKRDTSLHYWNFIVLGILGGAIGLQAFYVKNYWVGVFSVLFCWTYIPLIVSLIHICYWLFQGENEFNIEYNVRKPIEDDLLNSMRKDDKDNLS